MPAGEQLILLSFALDLAVIALCDPRFAPANVKRTSRRFVGLLIHISKIRKTIRLKNNTDKNRANIRRRLAGEKRKAQPANPHR